jgi:hypothetical protein
MHGAKNEYNIWLENLKEVKKDSIKMYFEEIILQLDFCGQCQI